MKRCFNFDPDKRYTFKEIVAKLTELQQTDQGNLLMSGSCHLDMVLNVEIGVECQIFVIVIFFNCCRVLQFGAHSRYYKGVLNQTRSFLMICTTFRYDFHVG